MKITILAYLVAVALSSAAGVVANVIPPSMEGTSDISYPAYTPHSGASIDSVEGTVNRTAGAAPANTVLGAAPNVPRSTTLGKGFFDRIKAYGPSSLFPRGNNNENNNDMEYLNLALLLSQLQFAFFENGLNRFSEEDFRRAGYEEWVRGRYEQIREHERAHVEFLQSAVTTSGRERVQPCDYVFNAKDIRAFVDISEAITTIAASGYIGGLHYFRRQEYITVLASILAVESRQAAWINASVRKQNPWNTAFETPLTPNQVLTLLSEFFNFDTMPSQNRGLLPAGVRPYPRLSLSPRLIPGEEAEISFPYSRQQKEERLYAAFVFGFETIFVVITEREEHGGSAPGSGGENRKKYFVKIPRDLAAKGTVFVSVVRGRENINEVRFDDASIVAGPAIALFPFDAHGKPIVNGQW